MMAFFIALNVGITAVVARRRGEERQEDARRTLKQGLVISAAAGILIGLISLLAARPFVLLAGALEDALFNAVYEQLGPSMSARMDDGTYRRIRSAELKDAADDVLGVLFDRLKVYSVSYESLHDYCMSTGSFAALRVLYTRYADFMPSSERKIIARIIRDCRPREQWESWLDPEDRA